MNEKTALVTGGSRGIGRAIARRLATDGMLVAVHYGRNETAARETVALIEKDGGRAFPVGAPLGEDGDVDRLFDRLEAGLRAHTGEARLDVVVNNAGGGEVGSMDQVTPEDFDRLFALNVRAPFFVIKRARPLLRDGGRIVNISSAVVRMAITLEVAYAMSKGAIEVMSRTVANELGARGITVNTVAPGMTRTDMSAPGFAAHPEMEPMIAGMAALGRVGEPGGRRRRRRFPGLRRRALGHRPGDRRLRRHLAGAADLIRAASGAGRRTRATGSGRRWRRGSSGRAAPVRRRRPAWPGVRSAARAGR